MLEEIRIHHFAIIDQLDIAFHPGLNVLTGETGAGKSIIIGALNLVVGGRADTDSIRSGQSTATVEARFKVEDPQTESLIAQMGIEPEDGTLIVRRIISQNNKNRVFLNGANITVSQLAELGKYLVDIHGQHDHQSLLHPEMHVELLDLYGGTTATRHAFDEAYRQYQKQIQQLRQIEKNQHERLQRQDLLQFQIEEIDSAGLSENEDDELQAEKNKLRHAETLHQAIDSALSRLVDKEGSALEALGQIRREIEPLTQYDSELSSPVGRADNAFFEAEALAEELRDYLQGIEFNPERLEEIEDRLAEINGLKRKYGNDVSAILEHRQAIGEELDTLSLSKEQVDDLKSKVAQCESELAKRACQLADHREKAAAKLKKGAEKELADLEMKGVVFQVQFDYIPEENSFVTYKKIPTRLNPNGLGNIQFLFSPNPGELPKPLAKIASGGELSRVMLALKSLLNKQSAVPSMVFDEVDSGISGRVAEKVGHKLKKIAAQKQVFCITHLPQIAGLAGAHFLVHKAVTGKRTHSAVTELELEQRVEEIARMSGGEVITSATREHAREMIKGSL